MARYLVYTMRQRELERLRALRNATVPAEETPPPPNHAKDWVIRADEVNVRAG